MKDQPEHIHVIINPNAGQQDAILASLNDVLHPSNLTWDVSITHATGDGARLAEKAINDGADIVAVCGGDGTVADVINGMVNTQTPLGIIPTGTGNAVANKLGIPADLKLATSLLINSHKRCSLDLGRITQSDDTQHHFILRASVGLHNTMLETATPALKQQYGNFAYMIAGVESLANIDEIDFELTIDGQDMTIRGHTCVVANMSTIGGQANFDFAPGVSPTDGMLDVFVFDTNSSAILEAIRSQFTPELSDFSNHWTGETIRIATDNSQNIYTDGEPLCPATVNINIVPQAIDIIAPEQEVTEEGSILA